MINILFFFLLSLLSAPWPPVLYLFEKPAPCLPRNIRKRGKRPLARTIKQGSNKKAPCACKELTTMD